MNSLRFNRLVCGGGRLITYGVLVLDIVCVVTRGCLFYHTYECTPGLCRYVVFTCTCIPTNSAIHTSSSSNLGTYKIRSWDKYKEVGISRQLILEFTYMPT